jgi:hypothetical protein
MRRLCVLHMLLIQQFYIKDGQCEVCLHRSQNEFRLRGTGLKGRALGSMGPD